MQQQTIYALDIGTRKIMGVVMQRREDCLEVLDSEMIEHSTRAMLDGQIHDVDAVAGTIRKITGILQERLQMPLTSAAVAAAGRALQTSTGKAAAKRSLLHEISADEVMALEIEAVQQARIALLQEQAHNNATMQYFCAGYSVVCYRLEDQEIQNLVGQVGGYIELEVIATFLPRVVVDSLFSALKRADLELLSMTLEPIAALAVAIPPGLRLLNLALVDIGAGTSDIAIIKAGNISAYAMVPMGGDELTETLARHYLLDFHHAEAVKRKLASEDSIQVEDILNNCVKVESQVMQDVLQPMINEIASQVAGHILNLNKKAPDAVVCIGGGSLTPGLIPALAEHLELPLNRVGIRTADGFEAIRCQQPELQGPQMVTPLGIAYHSFLNPPLPFISVTLNKAHLMLWNVGELNVGNALLSSGTSLASIYGRPGLGKTLTINGRVKSFPGTVGTAPLVKVNGQPASLDTPLQNGDEIEFIPGCNGVDARVSVRDLFDLEVGQVIVNGRPLRIRPYLRVNGQEAHPDMEIPDRARVDYQQANSLSHILQEYGIAELQLQPRTFHFVIDDEPRQLRWLPVKAEIDGRPAQPDEEVPWGAEVAYTLLPTQPTLRDALQDADVFNMTVYVNDQTVVIKAQCAGVFVDGKPAPLTHELAEGCIITLDHSGSNAILSDIFQVYDLKPNLKARLVLKVNGDEAGFTTPIRAGDRIQVYWEE